MAKIALINPNTSHAVTAAMLEIARSAAPAKWQIDGITASFGVPLITNEDELAVAADAVRSIKLPLRYDGMIVAAFGDPGCATLVTREGCPVVGIGEASMRAAAANARRFSVVTVTPDLVDAIKQKARALGLGRQLVSVRLTEGDAVILTAAPDDLIIALKDAVQRAVVNDGANAVIIGGGPLAQAARSLRQYFTVPIIEPLPEAVLALQRLLDK
jgi:allantoin racemase